jgi:hypothetical protein
MAKTMKYPEKRVAAAMRKTDQPIISFPSWLKLWWAQSGQSRVDSDLFWKCCG